MSNKFLCFIHFEHLGTTPYDWGNNILVMHNLYGFRIYRPDDDHKLRSYWSDFVVDNYNLM